MVGRIKKEILEAFIQAEITIQIWLKILKDSMQVTQNPVFYIDIDEKKLQAANEHIYESISLTK